MPDLPRTPDHDHPDTRPTPPAFPPEMPDLEPTRLQKPETATQAMPPAAPPRPAHYEKPKRGQPPPARRESALYLPLWSVLLMLFGVGGAAACLVVVVISLGGHPASTTPPRIIKFTAEPQSFGGGQTILATATLPPGVNALAGGAPSAFALDGPTLEPVYLSPTPETIAVGKSVIVSARDSGVNVRSNPFLGNNIMFVAAAGQIFTVIGGPNQADGLTWWQIQNPNDISQTGWAAAVYLDIAPQ